MPLGMKVLPNLSQCSHRIEMPHEGGTDDAKMSHARLPEICNLGCFKRRSGSDFQPMLILAKTHRKFIEGLLLANSYQYCSDLYQDIYCRI